MHSAAQPLVATARKKRLPRISGHDESSVLQSLTTAHRRRYQAAQQQYIRLTAALPAIRLGPAPVLYDENGAPV